MRFDMRDIQHYSNAMVNQTWKIREAKNIRKKDTALQQNIGYVNT